MIDLSFIPTGSGIGSLMLVFYGASRRFDPDRNDRLALLGTLLGASAPPPFFCSRWWPTYSHRAMWRGLAPYLIVAALVMAGAGVAYGLGAPAWLAYAALIVAMLAVLPGYDRWDRRQHPR